MNFHIHSSINKKHAGGFTLVESVVALAVIGVGVACTIGALTKMNTLAAMDRNLTGAYSVLTNQVDQFQSLGPFIPQSSQIPKDAAHTPPLYDMTTTTSAGRTVGYLNPTTGTVASTWPIYMEPPRWTYASAGARTGATGFSPNDVGQLAYQSDNKTYWRLQNTAPTWTADSAAGIPVDATVTENVTALTSAFATTTSATATAYHQAKFTITFTYLGKPYTLIMSTIRASDS